MWRKWSRELQPMKYEQMFRRDMIPAEISIECSIRFVGAKQNRE
jgi:hypothetical protein